MPPPLADTPPPLREVIARHGLGARRRLGQHFLLDANIVRRIARSAGALDGRTVVEIGPGPGGLTRALLETRAARVIAIERDARCVAALAALVEAHPGRLDLIEADARRVALDRLGTDLAIVANLPYNVATPLLIGWLRRIAAVSSMTLMLQKEVADRALARPGEPAYGRLSVIVQWLCEARRCFDVDPAAFVPRPRVTSTLIGLDRRRRPLAPARFATLERVTAHAFGRRRKMMRSALKGLVRSPETLLAGLGIPPAARAETLPVEAFCALARAVDAGPQDGDGPPCGTGSSPGSIP